LSDLGVKTLFIEPGSFWENGYIKFFNDKMRDELLDREIFTNLEEVKTLKNQRGREYNHFRPHSTENNKPPVSEAM
jgi:putative transposase